MPEFRVVTKVTLTFITTVEADTALEAGGIAAAERDIDPGWAAETRMESEVYKVGESSPDKG